MSNVWDKWKISDEVKDILNSSNEVILMKDRKQILSLAMGGKDDLFEVSYEVDGKNIVEATVAKCKNGLVVNYDGEYMRRRDPECMLIGDNAETDKCTFKDRINESFDKTRIETFDWLKKQPLAVLPIRIGGSEAGYYGLLIAPKNASFFVGGLADLQGLVSDEKILENFSPKAIVYLAPPLRHTHFKGKQIVVHNRTKSSHEVFSYNLYPGPSAKKGIYGVLLNIGEAEDWLTLHASTVKITTPYENITTILHEGASGGGKSEMLEYPHRESDGRLLLGKNLTTLQTKASNIT